MSYSALIVFRDSKAESDIELRNSHGTGPVAWTWLVEKYEQQLFPDRPLLPPRVFIHDGWDALFKLHAKIPLRPWERIVLQFTCDNAVVAAEHSPALADALDRFEDAHKRPHQVCHLATIAKRLRELGPTTVALYATSVCEDPWTVREGEGDDAEWRPYDLTRDTRHWFVDVAGINARGTAVAPE